MEAFRNCSFLLMLFFILSGCSGTKHSGNHKEQPPLVSSPLTETKWELQSMPGITISCHPLPYLIFSENSEQVVGFTGCNSLQTAYVAHGDTMMIGVASVSERVCDFPHPENEMLTMFRKTNRYRITGNTMELMQHDQLLGTFIATTATSEIPFEVLNGNWELESIDGSDKSMDELFAYGNPTLLINTADMSYSGFGGCNNFYGKFSATEESVTFGDAIATMKACQGVDESIFLQKLREVNTYKKNGKKLVLLSGAMQLMTFSKLE